MRLASGSILLIPLSFYCLAVFPYLSLPGPYQDELLFLQGFKSYDVGGVVSGITIGDDVVPLMIMPYVGALKTWLFYLVFAVTPHSLVTVRTVGIILGMGTLIATYIAVRKFFGPLVATLATSILATDPSFVHTIRIDWGPVAIMQLLKSISFLLFVLWWESRWPVWLGASMFLVGLALWDKANFIWILGGLAIAAVVAYPRFTKDLIQTISRKEIAIGVLCAICGALPLISYNLQRPAGTVVESAHFEWNPHKIYAARGTFTGTAVLSLTAGDCADCQPSAATQDVVDRLSPLSPYNTTMTWQLLGLSVLLLPLVMFTERRQAILFCLCFSVVTYGMMFMMKQGGGSAHHVVMLYPMPFLFLVLTILEAGRKLRVLPLAIVVLLVAIGANCAMNAKYIRAYLCTGGIWTFSDRMSSLVDYMAAHPERRYLLLDWGFSAPVGFLGHSRGIRVQDLTSVYYKSEYEKEDVDRILKAISEENAEIIIFSPERTIIPIGRKLVEELVADGKLKRVKVFWERSGTPLYETYREAESPLP